MSKQTLVTSTIVLTVATLISKVLGSVFRIPLQNIAGDEVLGIFSLVYPVYMVALILSVAGLPLAISKLISAADQRKKQTEIRDIYVTASILALLFGLISFTLIYVFRSPISYLLGGESTELALIISSMTLLIAPYMAVYRGYFQGLGDMIPTALSQVFEQLIRAVLIIVIAYTLIQFNYATHEVAGYIMFGSIAGVLVSLAFLRFQFIKQQVKPVSNQNYSFKTFLFWSKRVLSISIPIAIGSLTMALFNVVDSLTIPFALRANGLLGDAVNYQYGIYGRGLALVQIATVFATSIVLPLVPLITKKIALGDIKGTKLLIEKTHYLSHLISWPAAFGLLGLTLPLNLGLFTDLNGSSMLAIIHFSSVFTAFVLVGTGILQGINKVKTAAYIIIGGVMMKVVLNIMLIQLFDLDGAALATLIVYALLMIINLVFIKREIPFKFITREAFIMALSALFMGAIIALPTQWIDFSSVTRLFAISYLLIAVIVGGTIYFALLVVFKAIDEQFLRDVPIIGKLFR